MASNEVAVPGRWPSRCKVRNGSGESMATELQIPPGARSDSQARELLRVWVAHGQQHVSLASDAWEDPAAWGIMVVDLCKHMAQAVSLSTGRDRSEVLSRIRAGFDAEWNAPTDIPSGRLLHDDDR